MKQKYVIQPNWLKMLIILPNESWVREEIQLDMVSLYRLRTNTHHKHLWDLALGENSLCNDFCIIFLVLLFKIKET